MKYRRNDDLRRNDVSDEEWTVSAPLTPAQGRMGRPRSTDPRCVFDGLKAAWKHVRLAGRNRFLLPADIAVTAASFAALPSW